MEKRIPDRHNGKKPRSEQLLKEARGMYMNQLNDGLDQLALLAGGPETDRAKAGEVYRLLHTIKGSAPVFGLDRLGAIALKHLPEWEWATSAESGMEVPPWHRNWPEKAGRLHRLLAVEQEFCAQELELDEKKLSGPKDALGVQGSRILIIDDDGVLRSFLHRRLTLDGYEADAAESVDEALLLLRESKYDLILLDLMMQPRSGYELFEILKEDPTLKWIPLIVLSGRDDVTDKVRCFRLGSDDYVTKPFQYEELEARIHSLIKRTRTYEQLAFLDPLTGVSNRRYFDHQLELELQRASRYPAPLTLVFIDIDRFKRINDTYGHTIGDQVLQALAYLLQQNLRASDLLARYGGEEFVVVMPNTEGEVARHTIELILARVRQAPVAVVDGEELRITFSAGIAEWIPGEGREHWIHRADQAMYAAKQDGRNRASLYEPRMEEEDDEGMEQAHEDGAAVKKKLLIADDDRVVRSILASKFRERQVEVLEARDGDEALRIILSERPDAAIIDGLMPKRSGLELLEAIRADESVAGLKILMLSGLSKRKDIVRGLQSGADDYMAKPFSLLELELRVNRLLGL